MTGIKVGEKFLVTTDGWFYGPDGRQYRGAYGTVRGVHTAEDTLGVRPNGRSTNWYLEIGRVTIAGCQVHYAVQCDECNFDLAKDWTSSGERGVTEFDRPSAIYQAD
jgi:hypothetical protein